MDSTFLPYEELLLKSWDAPLLAEEQSQLARIMQQDYSLRKQSDQYLKIRELLLRDEKESFGPFFAERIVHVIKNRAENIEYLFFFFFKKYQALVLGVFVALLIANLLLSDQFTIQSLFGLEHETTDEVLTIDLYKNLTP